MKALPKVISLLLCLLPTLVHAETRGRPSTLYVAKNGSDEWSGRLRVPNPSRTDGPLASLQAAQARVRSMLKEHSGPIEVVIRGGTYRLEEPLVFAPDDSGRPGIPVVWTSHPKERAILSGGRAIRDWKKVSEILPGLPDRAHGQVWQADVGKGTSFYSLFSSRGVLPQAASPKLHTSRDKAKSSHTRLHWQGDDLDSVADGQDPFLHILPTYYFVYNIFRVKSLDRQNKILEVFGDETGHFSFPLFTRQDPFEEHCYYRIANVIEHLDEPGEWVLNTTQGTLYYWPLDSREPGDDVSYPVSSELVSFRGDLETKNWVRHITLQGLTLRNTERMRFQPGRALLMAHWDVFDGSDAVVNLRGAREIAVRNCVIENSGGTGIRSGIYSTHNQFSHNVIRSVGLSGITLIGHGPGKVSDNHHNLISHNEISHTGEIWGSGMGIFIAGSSYNHVHNNLVHHTANHAIALNGGFSEWFMQPKRRGRPYFRFDDLDAPPEDDDWYVRRAYTQTRHNLVEYNEVHSTGHGDKMADINCLYSHGSADGNVFQRNYVHDVDSDGLNAAVRTDDWQFFARFTENVIRDIDAPGVVMKEVNDFENNVLINLKDACFVFKKKWNWEGGLRVFPLYGTNLRRNIMVQSASSEGSSFAEENRIGPFYLAPYRPELLGQPMADNNIFFVTDDSTMGDEALKQAQALGIDEESVAADPLFVDLEKGDLRFKDGSPARKLGISPLTEYGIQEPAGLQPEYRHPAN